MPTATSKSPSEPSRRLALSLLGGLAALLLASPGQAQWREPMEKYGLETLRLTDPMDGSHFEARALRSTNGLGGYDSDGCSYAKGLQARTFSLATSPSTLFTASVADFPRALTASQKQELVSVLAAFGPPEEVTTMSAATGYEIGAAVARVLGKGHYRVGELYLSGAWTVRDTIVGFLPGLQGVGDTWRKLADVSARAQQQTNDPAKTRAMFDLSRICHRGGFLVERETFLELLATFPDAGLGAMEKRAEFRRRVVAEQRLLQLAKAEFQAGRSAGEGSPADQSYYLYLVGDIDRRAGEFEAAAVALQQVTHDKQTAEEVVVLAQDILRVLEVQDKALPGAVKRPVGGESK